MIKHYDDLNDADQERVNNELTSIVVGYPVLFGAVWTFTYFCGWLMLDTRREWLIAAVFAGAVTVFFAVGNFIRWILVRWWL